MTARFGRLFLPFELPSDLSAELYQDGAWINAGEVSGKEFHYSGEVGLLELRLTTQSYYQVENISIRMQQLSSGRFQRGNALHLRTDCRPGRSRPF